MIKMLCLSLGLCLAGSFASAASDIVVVPEGTVTEARILRTVNIPERDQFVPFGVRIRAGDVVRWINNDEDPHTVTSVNQHSSPGFRGVDYELHGTDSQGHNPGVLYLRFNRPGTFIYHCRHHSKLDAVGQPIAPGPDGGIPGTPMMGVITVMPR